MEKIIEVVGLSKNYGDNLVLDNVNFSIEKGSIVGLIGKSGCGKTTLLNLLVGFLKPGLGYVAYEGANTTKNDLVLRKNVGFAAQEGSFYKKLSTVENIEYFGKLYGLDKGDIKERIGILLEIFKLEKAGKVLGENLSIGMQKRLDIACSLIHDPEVLLLDEPTANLDPILRTSILELIKKVNDSGTTVLISSHMLDEVRGLCDKVLLIEDRKVKVIDNPYRVRVNIDRTLMDNKVVRLVSKNKDYSKLVSALIGMNLIDNYTVKNNELMLNTKDLKGAMNFVEYYFKENEDNLITMGVVETTMSSLFDNAEN